MGETAERIGSRAVYNDLVSVSAVDHVSNDKHLVFVGVEDYSGRQGFILLTESSGDEDVAVHAIRGYREKGQQ